MAGHAPSRRVVWKHAPAGPHGFLFAAQQRRGCLAKLRHDAATGERPARRCPVGGAPLGGTPLGGTPPDGVTQGNFRSRGHGKLRQADPTSQK